MAPTVREQVMLAGYTTLGVGGPAARFVDAGTDEQVIAEVREADATGEPVLVLGGGSNLVVADEGFPGTVVHVATSGVASKNDSSIFACGQKIGVKAITSVIPTGISTAENTRLNASNALSSRTRPVAFRTNRLRPPPGGCAPLRIPVVVT